jgi:hypothetical protein
VWEDMKIHEDKCLWIGWEWPKSCRSSDELQVC